MSRGSEIGQVKFHTKTERRLPRRDNQGSHETRFFSLSLSGSGSPSSPHLVVSGFSIVPWRCTRTARYRGRKPAAHIVLKRARNLPVHFHPLGCRACSLLALSNYAIAVCTYTPPSPLQDVCIYTHTIFSRVISPLSHIAPVCSYMHALFFASIMRNGEVRFLSLPLCSFQTQLCNRHVHCALCFNVCVCACGWKKNWRATHAWCEKRRLGTNKFIIYFLLHSTCEVDSARFYFKHIIFRPICDPPIIVLVCAAFASRRQLRFSHIQRRRARHYLRVCRGAIVIIFRSGSRRGARISTLDISVRRLAIGPFCLICVSDCLCFGLVWERQLW